MPQREVDGSLIELFASLGADLPRLVRKEVALAKAEIAEAGSRTASAGALLAAGTVFAIGAVGVLMAAAVAAARVGLTALGLDPATAAAVAPLVVAAVAGLIAAMLFLAASVELRAARARLETSASSLAADATMLTEKLHD